LTPLIPLAPFSPRGEERRGKEGRVWGRRSRRPQTSLFLPLPGEANKKCQVARKEASLPENHTEGWGTLIRF